MIVFIVEWVGKSGEPCEEYFNDEESANLWASKVSGIVIEKDVS